MQVGAQGYMDPWTWLQGLTTSLLANVVVLGLAGASIITLGGAFYLVVNFDVAKKHVLNGVILTLVMGMLAWVQLGMVPRSFTEIGELGLMTVPAGGATAILDIITSALKFATTWIGNVLVGMGLMMTVARVNWGPKMVIVGVVMNLLAAITAGDGLIVLAVQLVTGILA